MSLPVIYTDLDGTLLNHDSYSHEAADPLLRELKDSHIPVVPCSSKTRAELLPLREELNNQHPFIIENGAAVFIPKGYFSQQPEDTRTHNDYWVKEFSLPREHWAKRLSTLGEAFSDDFTTFSEMSVADIMRLTGLNAQQAELAAQREFGEPVYWQGSVEQRNTFIEHLRKEGIGVLQGGRFLHIAGSNDKGQAINWLHSIFTQNKSAGASIAAGDSQNDAAMLEAADFALIIRSPVHPPPELNSNNQQITSASYGPEGWNEGIRNILKTLETNNGEQ